MSSNETRYDKDFCTTGRGTTYTPAIRLREESGLITVGQASARLAMSRERFAKWCGQHGIEIDGDNVHWRSVKRAMEGVG